MDNQHLARVRQDEFIVLCRPTVSRSKSNLADSSSNASYRERKYHLLRISTTKYILPARDRSGRPTCKY